MQAQATKQGLTVETQIEPGEVVLNHNTMMVRERAPRPQTQPPERDPMEVHAGVLSHLRNALGLALVFIGVIGTMYLIFGNLAR